MIVFASVFGATLPDYVDFIGFFNLVSDENLLTVRALTSYISSLSNNLQSMQAEFSSIGSAMSHWDIIGGVQSFFSAFGKMALSAFYLIMIFMDNIFVFGEICIRFFGWFYNQFGVRIT